MAERRMFAQTIIDSDAFLDMPLSSQALYFHLSMRADDEGFINNPKKIQRTIGASDDDLKVLIAKSFIIPFESGIVVIKHWKIHNYIRNDRLHETKYLEEKALLQIKENGAYTLSAEQCRAIDGQMSDECQHRLDKDSIDKNSIDKNILSSENSEKNRTNYQEIIDLYHQNCPSLPKVTKITDARKKLINARLKDYSIGELVNAFAVAEASDFLKHGNGTWNGANFDWIMNPNNIVKILEGNYRNKESKSFSQGKGYQNANNPDFLKMLEQESKQNGSN